jgi:hypothetical protein
LAIELNSSIANFFNIKILSEVNVLMGLFEQYGIKEVADVTIYSIHKKTDGSGELYYVPALYLDTLKVSTVEKTAESVWAQGGLGNSKLICWDYGKEINLTLEDALCTPASLSLCWGGVLSSDWKNAELSYDNGICFNRSPVQKLSRMTKSFYPRHDGTKATISNLLPKLKTDAIDNALNVLKISSVVDGTRISGMGICNNHSYQWKMAIESAVQSIAVVPDRFFDIKGRSYPIDTERKVSALDLPTYDNYKDAVIYKINDKKRCLPPPIPKIIFDENMAAQGEIKEIELKSITLDESLITLGKFLSESGFKIYTDFHLEKDGKKYFALRGLDTKILGEYNEDKTSYVFSLPNDSEYLFEVAADSDLDSSTKSTIELNLEVLTGNLITYYENHAATDLKDQIGFDTIGSVDNVNTKLAISKADYLAIIVDNNNEYKALVGQYASDSEDEPSETVVWFKPATAVNVSQFKGIDMWLRFKSMNEMIYFLLTKYEDDIQEINPLTIKPFIASGKVDKDTTIEEINEDSDSKAKEGKLWAYVNPKTMLPYDDDYWFHQGEPYYIKSLTFAPHNQKIKGKRIEVKADQWPGMYMIVGETSIRERETGEDERVQLKFPLCKIKSDQSLTLEADGDPTVFSMDVEVARPVSGIMMEITSYEVASKMIDDGEGHLIMVDGSTEVLSE